MVGGAAVHLRVCVMREIAVASWDWTQCPESVESKLLLSLLSPWGSSGSLFRGPSGSGGLGGPGGPQFGLVGWFSEKRLPGDGSWGTGNAITAGRTRG